MIGSTAARVEAGGGREKCMMWRKRKLKERDRRSDGD